MKLMKRAAVAGLTPAEFWTLTPVELTAAVAGADERVVTAAWIGEALAREKRLKPLRTYLPRRAPDRGEVEAARADLEDIRAGLQARGLIRG